LKKILLFGAGRSATVLIDYLLKEAEKETWRVIIVDADINLVKSKTGNSPYAEAASFDINDEARRKEFIADADIVISLLPPALHTMAAKTCVELNKNLLTASYVDEEIKKLKTEIEKKELLFLCEMGLDPGIDHMSAMKMIDEIHAAGGRIVSFKSHCGGLVAPESDDNPWRYKISWNARNVALAGKAGAHYKEKGKDVHVTYEKLFNPENGVEIPELGWLSYYPNRDSLSYMPLYGLEDAQTFIRTTLRYPDFIYGWNNVIELKLTDETPRYETDGRTLYEVFKEHMHTHGFGDWLNQKLSERFKETKSMLENLMKLMEAEKEAEKEGADIPENFMMADAKGHLQNIEVDEVKNRGVAYMGAKMHEANLTLKQLFFLGLDDQQTLVNKGFCSPADILQFAMEKKLVLDKEDRDMIVMMHEIHYATGKNQQAISSTLIVKGDDNIRTAMAKTVGLPLGIAAKLILAGKIRMTGLHIPVKKEIYGPVLNELKEYGIQFNEVKL
jgi:saccharopine dehydrogenase-like NADP-dependent oxidoreductase